MRLRCLKTASAVFSTRTLSLAFLSSSVICRLGRGEGFESTGLPRSSSSRRLMVAEGGIGDISAPVTIPLSCGVHGGSGRIIPSPVPRTSVREAGRGCSIPSPAAMFKPPPIGSLMTPSRLRSQDRLPVWQAGADFAALQPLGTEPSCAGRLRSSPTPGWRSGAPSIFCQIPAFSVRWMVTACEGKKEGSCGPSWIYVTSCRDGELLSGG